jgi:hypothetical protein
LDHDVVLTCVELVAVEVKEVVEEVDVVRDVLSLCLEDVKDHEKEGV